MVSLNQGRSGRKDAAIIDYVELSAVEPDDFLSVVNSESLRTHLVKHDYFNPHSIRDWLAGKIDVDKAAGCRVRAVVINGQLAGWCGVQPDDDGYEIAIVIARDYWGLGLSVFYEVMTWADELGHEEVVFHLLDTRPEYKALAKRVNRVTKTTLLGRVFTTYFISVKGYSR